MSHFKPHFMGVHVIVQDTDDAFGTVEIAKLAILNEVSAGRDIERIIVTAYAYQEMVYLDLLDFTPECYDRNIEKLDQLDERVRSKQVINVTNNHNSSDASSFATGFLLGGLFNA